MKAILLLTGGGALAVLTSYDSPNAPALLKKLEAKGINKFIAYEIPLDLARKRYGRHFSVVEHDLHESDDLRVLDYNGERAFSLFHFDELTGPMLYESERAQAEAEASVRAAEDVQ